jgi:hypothetical protein
VLVDLAVIIGVGSLALLVLRLTGSAFLWVVDWFERHVVAPLSRLLDWLGAQTLGRLDDWLATKVFGRLDDWLATKVFGRLDAKFGLYALAVIVVAVATMICLVGLRVLRP